MHYELASPVGVLGCSTPDAQHAQRKKKKTMGCYLFCQTSGAQSTHCYCVQISHSPGVPVHVGIDGSVTTTPRDFSSPCRLGVLGPGLVGAGGSCLCISSRTVALTMSSRDASVLEPVDGPPVIVVELLAPTTGVPAATGGNSGSL